MNTLLKSNMRRTVFAAWPAFLTAPALAHEGHGLFGSHWHATDAWGYAALALAMALTLWLFRGKK